MAAQPKMLGIKKKELDFSCYHSYNYTALDWFKYMYANLFAEHICVRFLDFHSFAFAEGTSSKLVKVVTDLSAIVQKVSIF